MFREEWRLHAQLFGTWRFAAFPLLVATITAAGVAGLAWAGVALEAAILGLHLLVFAFGLQTGSVGLVARDALERLLGEVSLLVSTWRHLPLSRRAAVAAFLVRDLGYYTAFVLLPVSIAFVPAGLLVDPALLSAAPRLALSLPVTFALGLATTTALIALVERGALGKLTALLGTLALAAAWWRGLPVGAISPYRLYVAPFASTALAVALLVVGLGTIGVAGLGRQEPRAARQPAPALELWADRLRDDRGLVARSLLELSRSAGGVGTVAFSGGVLLAVATGVVALVGRMDGVDPATGLTFGPLLGLAAFTTYNWLTTATDAPTYRRFPLTIGDVVDAKRRALAIVGLPVGLGYLAIALAWLGTDPVDALLGGVLLVGLHQYVGGLTAFLAGLRPNEFLFDTALFGAFGLAVALPLAPLLVVGLVLPAPSLSVLVGVGTVAVVLGAVGTVLGRRAGPRWERRYRLGLVD